MTKPSLDDMMAAVREPGWYWVRVFEGAPWHPYHWYHSRDGEAFWIGRAVDDEPMAEIGPRIPDPVTLQQHERTVSERDTAQTICGEAYQAVGALAHYMGLSDHPDIIRLMDNLARHDNPPHQTLLPWPKEDIPDIRQQHERAMNVVEAARDLLRYAGIKHPSSDTIVAPRERALALEAALAALDAAKTETGAGDV